MNEVLWLVTSDIEDIGAMYGKKKNGYLGFIYAIEYGDHLKIGSTSNPYQRLKSLQASAKNYGTIVINRMMVSKPHTNYRENERQLHLKHKDQRVKAELFNILFDGFETKNQEMNFLDETEKLKAKTDYVVGQFMNFTLGKPSVLGYKNS